MIWRRRKNLAKIIITQSSQRAQKAQRRKRRCFPAPSLDSSWLRQISVDSSGENNRFGILCGDKQNRNGSIAALLGAWEVDTIILENVCPAASSLCAR